jgi:AcrR family transcriptional regulator
LIPGEAEALRPKPYGGEAVCEALLDSATVLFTADGPARVSLRAIADHAGVNLGQIPRHFGTKEALLQAVMGRAAADIAGTATDPTGSTDGASLTDSLAIFDATGASPYWRLLAHVILDGIDPVTLQQDTPTFRRLVAMLDTARASGEVDEAFDPRTLAAAMGALSMGWLLFEPFLVAATGLDGEKPERVRADVRDLFLEMISRLAPSTGRACNGDE